jgi:hypothetical protein
MSHKHHHKHKEVWKTIYKGYYAVSNMGRVRRLKPGSNNTYVGKILTPQHSGYGRNYLIVQLWLKNKKVKQRYVHILVAREFIGPCPDGYEVDHKNHVTDDCRVSNLRYLPQPINGSNPGELNGRALINAHIARKIRRIIKKKKYTYQEIADKLGISRSIVADVGVGKTWKDA